VLSLAVLTVLTNILCNASRTVRGEPPELTWAAISGWRRKPRGAGEVATLATINTNVV
jgi:hypothetical protein